MENEKQNLNIWIVRTLCGNPLDKKARMERASAFADYLARNDNHVTFWGTAFDHFKKKKIYSKTTRVRVSNNELTVFIHSPVVYKKNISPKRYLYSYFIAKRLSREIKNEQRYPAPDIIYCAWPTEHDCRIMLEYGKEKNIPVIIDARDKWPDVFELALPDGLRFLAPIILKPMKMKAKRDFSDATAIYAMSEEMLKWALTYAGRKKTYFDKTFYISSKQLKLNNVDKIPIMKQLKEAGVTEKTWNLCMFTSFKMTREFDIETVIKAVEKVYEQYPFLHFIIGGAGYEVDSVESLFSDKPYIHLMGMLNEEEMAGIMSISKAGLYPNTNGWGNQVGQFFSGSLPLVTSSKGTADKYIKKYNCGMPYRFGDVEDLAEKIIFLIEHEEKRKEMSVNASARYEEDFEFQRVSERMAKGLEEVLEAYKNKDLRQD